MMKKLVFAIMIVLVVPVFAVRAQAPAEATDPEAGFISVFNGKDLTGWDGDPRLWSAKDGVIRGETTEENPARNNTFLIWKDGKLRDFILKIKFRIQNGNSGIQYRSKEFDKWRIAGYQAEVCNSNAVGFLYHEAGRASLVSVGDMVVIDENGKKDVVGKVSDAKALWESGYYKERDWNEYTIIARGNHILHYLNGYPTVELIDNDKVTTDDPQDRKGAQREGVLALQIHVGPPMIVEFKDIKVKHLKDEYGEAICLFNGKDLTGWAYSSDALKESFSVKDGVIAVTGNPAGYIRTIKDFKDYVVRVQLRHIKPGNSGLLVQMTGQDKVWPKSIEAQGMSDNMGDIWNIDKVSMNVDMSRTSGRRTVKLHPSNERPMGQWNDYEVYLSGGNLKIYVNRLLQNYATDCEQSPGKICLQSEGSPKEFRNVVLIPIEK